MKNISTAKARQQLSDIINRAAYGKERVILTRRGKKVAAVVPLEDLRLIEGLEERLDVEAAREAEAEAKAKGEKPIPWKKAKKRLGH